MKDKDGAVSTYLPLNFIQGRLIPKAEEGEPVTVMTTAVSIKDNQTEEMTICYPLLPPVLLQPSHSALMDYEITCIHNFHHFLLNGMK
jgi:hypothetical protein